MRIQKNGLGINHEISAERAWPYWLRTPAARDGDGYSALNIWIDGDVHSTAVYLGCIGVRPAFYLNDKAELYGSGSRSEPYRADEIAVAVNGSRVKFDVPPVIENDRTLVPIDLNPADIDNIHIKVKTEDLIRKAQ